MKWNQGLAYVSSIPGLWGLKNQSNAIEYMYMNYVLS
jgi:hypothetical protein